MTDDHPDTFLGAFFQFIIALAGIAFGLTLMGGLLVLFASMMGVMINMFFGNVPGILEPFGGELVGLLSGLVKLLANVTIVIIAIVITWLMATGQLDEMLDETVDETLFYDSQQQSDMNQNSKPSGRNTSLADSSDPNDTIESSDDVESDKYGQLREK